MQASLELAYEFMTFQDYVSLAADAACHLVLALTWGSLLIHYYKATTTAAPPVGLSPDGQDNNAALMAPAPPPTNAVVRRPQFRIEYDIFEEDDYMTSQ